MVSCAGEPILYLERGGRSLQTLPAAAAPAAAEAATAALATLVGEGRLRSLELQHVDGVRIGDSPWRERLAAVGFRPGYRGWVLRAAAR